MGRIGYDLSTDRLLLHTIQTAEAVDTLLSTGVLVPDTSLAEPLYADAYAWMLQQMAMKLTTVGDGALWFWAKIRRQDLVELCRQSAGEVLLTCRVPPDRVLLSHFHDWHSVLNESPLAPEIPGESDEDLEARLDRMFDDFEDRLKAAGARNRGRPHWPEDLQAEVERSWESILEPGNYGRFGSWQATMHELRADDVVGAVRLER
jgi:hypothetical protein